MPPTITATAICQHCQQPFQTKRPKQAKWCPTHRIARAIVALSNYPGKACLGCGKPFYKLDRKQTICCDCSPFPMGEARESHCSLCDSGTRLMPGLACCYPCATRGGKRHSVVVSAMVKRLKADAK